MSAIYTKKGIALNLSDGDLFSRSGRHVGRVRGDKAYGPDGRYVGTLVGNRLVYRSKDSAEKKSAYSPRSSNGHSTANQPATAISGEEPPIPH
jgi:hypothetical protein